MTPQLVTLENGLRVLMDPVSTVDTVAVGVWVDAGARHETPRNNGVAHLIEHMMFKGTPSRSAMEIAQAVENVGGQINAYTAREMTSYHVHLLKEDLPLAVDILSDIVQNPLFDEEELEKERQVVLQEIGMTLDTPDDYVFDLCQETAWPNQPLGAPILGRAPVIGVMPRAVLQSFVEHHYGPERLIVSVAGNFDPEQFPEIVRTRFPNASQTLERESLAPAVYEGGESRVEKDLEQVHFLLSLRGLEKADPDYYAAMALSMILGGGMSSRLFQEVREKRGLVYSVFSFHSSYRDDGLFGVYAGTGPERLTELVPVICEELCKATCTITEEEVRKAKTQIRANLLMGRESMMTRADQQARYLINHGRVPDLSETLRRIEAVSLKQIERVAGTILKTTPTIAAIGPLGNLESSDRIRERLAA